MTETWFPWCIKYPGPAWKQGYTGAPSRPLSEIAGEVKHSMEGWMAYALGYMRGEIDPNRTASWHFSVALDGTTYQHYPLEAVTWHCGLAGDRRLDTALIGNLTLLGTEHEGTSGILTAAQRASSVRISLDARRLCPVFGGGAPTLRKNLWEHNWLSATSCPSGRIPWNDIIREVQQAEQPQQEEDMAKLIKGSGSAIYVTDGMVAVALPNVAVATEAKKVCGDVINVSDAYIAWLSTPPPDAAGVREEVKRGLVDYGGKIRTWCAEGVAPLTAELRKALDWRWVVKEGDNAVYRLEDTPDGSLMKRHAVNRETFHALGGDFVEVRALPAAVFDMIPTGRPLPNLKEAIP